MVKPHFRGNHDAWWPLNLSSTSLVTAAPRQELPGGGESTKVVVADDNGDYGPVLKLRDDDRKHPWGGIVFSLEHYGG